MNDPFSSEAAEIVAFLGTLLIVIGIGLGTLYGLWSMFTMFGVGGSALLAAIVGLVLVVVSVLYDGYVEDE
jgi:hypothetical protein